MPTQKFVQTFIAAFFIRVKMWTQPKCSSPDEQIKYGILYNEKERITDTCYNMDEP